jgi:hypothetical protein
MTKKLAAKGAQSCGINMDVECAWNAKKDNIFQNLPQVNLHGMDEGLTLKMCTNILRTTVEEAQSLNRKMNTTSVSDTSMLNVLAYLYSYH